MSARMNYIIALRLLFPKLPLKIAERVLDLTRDPPFWLRVEPFPGLLPLPAFGGDSAEQGDLLALAVVGILLTRPDAIAVAAVGLRRDLLNRILKKYSSHKFRDFVSGFITATCEGYGIR